MDFSWARDYPDVHQTCSLFNRTELADPLRFHYTPLKILLQEGPQCGLVALAAALGHPTKEYVDLLLSKAEENGYTNHGEMFSASNLANLAELLASNSINTVQLFSGSLDCDEIKDYLMNGKLILVPYDNNKDFSPTTLNGTKSHWSILSGSIETHDDFYVIAKHGKSLRVNIWSLAELAKSNSQLNEVGIYEKDPNINFKIPKGGVTGPLGLKSKAVIISSTNNT